MVWPNYPKTVVKLLRYVPGRLRILFIRFLWIEIVNVYLFLLVFFPSVSYEFLNTTLSKFASIRCFAYGSSVFIQTWRANVWALSNVSHWVVILNIKKILMIFGSLVEATNNGRIQCIMTPFYLIIYYYLIFFNLVQLPLMYHFHNFLVRKWSLSC